MRRQAGMTLLEVLIVAASIAVITGAAGAAYIQTVGHRRQIEVRRDAEARRMDLEDRLRGLLQGAYVSERSGADTTFFIGEVGGDTVGGNADTLIFTTTGARLPAPLLASEDEFEAVHERYGPHGGIAEVQIGTTPVGDAGELAGVFVRVQRPADGDPTQGGFESVLDPDVRTIAFEFFDGTDWQTTWDTRTQDQRRIPAAVRVAYTLEDDAEDTPQIFIVALPHSDVTPENPVTVRGTGGTP